MKKIAILSQAFEASTLGLANALSTENFVDVYFHKGYHTDLKMMEAVMFYKLSGHFPCYKLDKDNSLGLSFFDNLNNVSLFLDRFPIRMKGMKLLSLLYLKYYIRILKHYDFIIIIGHSDYLVELSIRLASTNIKHIHILHEIYNNKTGIVLHSVRQLVENKISILLHSEYIRNELIKNFPYSKEYIKVIPFSLFLGYKDFDKNKKEVLDIIGDNRYILSYGFISKYKGYDNLWEIYTDIKARGLLNFKIVVAGHGYDDYVEKMKYNSDFIVINKFLSNDDIATLINHSLLVVCPYKKASQSGIPVSAYCFAKPVIANNVGAFSEYIKSEACGKIVSSNKEFSDAILDIINGNNFISEKVVASLNNWKVIAEQYKDLYNL